MVTKFTMHVMGKGELVLTTRQLATHPLIKPSLTARLIGDLIEKIGLVGCFICSHLGIGEMAYNTLK